VSFKLVEFNQEEQRFNLAKIIIIDELPFNHVEGAGFKGFMSCAQPRWKFLVVSLLLEIFAIV